MDKETRKKILKDYHEAQKHVAEVLAGGINGFVKNLSEYLMPSITYTGIELNDEYGKLDYFRTIRDTLEKILITGKGEFSWHFREAPDYIQNLLIKEESTKASVIRHSMVFDSEFLEPPKP